MFVNEDGRVSGSIDSAALKALHDATGDPELKAHYASLVSAELYESWLEPAPEPEPQPEPAPEPAGALQPAQADPKSAWVDWAVANGADRAEAEAMTKADLIAAYGG